MLRAKQITNLSSSARSILFSGSRCGAADGSSCTCSEDDTCPGGNKFIRNDVLRPKKHSSLVPRSLPILTSADPVKVVQPHKVDSTDHPTVLRKAVSTPSSIGGSEHVRYVNHTDEVQKDTVSSAPHISDQIVKVGIAAANVLSDLVNYKIPGLDGSGVSNLPMSSMVGPIRPVPTVKTVKPKTSRTENVSRVSPSTFHEAAARPSSHTSSYNGRATKAAKSGQRVEYSQVPISGSRNSETHGASADAGEKKSCMLERPKTHQHHHMSSYNSKIRTSEANFVGGIKECFNKSSKDPRTAAGPHSVPRPPMLSSGHVVERVSHILQGLKWGPAAEKALESLNCAIDVYQANQVLKHIQDHSVALGFFHWLKRQGGFKHDGYTYTTMVGILGRAKQFGSVKKLLNEMLRDGCQPNVVTYNRLIHNYGRANYLTEAMNVFNQMQEAGCAPDRVTYCTLIDIHAKAGYLDVAMYMYQRMQEVGLSPDTFTYSVIINCLGKAGHLSAAHKLFCEMADQGCIPNLVTYNILIALQAKSRNYQIALKLYRDMQNAGFEPDKVTYSIIMEVLGHCGYLEEAEAVFTEMKQKNWVPDELVYGLLVDLWGKAGNVDKAWGWYQSMLSAGLCPNVPTCNSLLSTFLRDHRLADAYELLQSMLALGLKPSSQTYTLLLSFSTEAKSPYDLGFCCELMSVTGHPAHSFLLSMPAAGPDGQNVRDHTDRFLDLMHSEDRESKRGLVDAVVDFLHKAGLKEEAGSVWEVAAQKNVYPDAIREKGSGYWMINLHVMSDGTAVTALSRTLAWFRRQMLISGVGPSRVDIVTGWGRRSRVTGSSLVRQAVEELLNMFSFPFFTENGNSGCFVGCGEPLNRWLLQSYVERMHLV